MMSFALVSVIELLDHAGRHGTFVAKRVIERIEKKIYVWMNGTTLFGYILQFFDYTLEDICDSLESIHKIIS
jgi:hypothetical protein